MTNRRLSPVDRYRHAAGMTSHGRDLEQPDATIDDGDLDRTSVYVVLIGIAAIALAVCVLLGLPLSGRAWDFRIVVATISVAAICGWKALAYVRDVESVRVRAVAPVLGALLVSLLLLGAMTQLVIDGRPKLATSDEARAHELVRELYSDLLELGVHDELLSMSQADARARYNSYEPAARALQTIANRWARVDLGTLPDPELIEVVGHVKTAATFGAEAINIRYILITEPDDRREAALTDNRAAFVSETLAAGAKLKPLAERYLVAVVHQGGGE